MKRWRGTWSIYEDPLFDLGAAAGLAACGQIDDGTLLTGTQETRAGVCVAAAFVR